MYYPITRLRGSVKSLRKRPIKESEIKIEMRLLAVEILTANLLSLFCLTSEAPKRNFDTLKKQMIEGAQKQTFSSDAVTSDHYAAELESALGVLLSMAEKQIGEVLKGLQE